MVYNHYKAAAGILDLQEEAADNTEAAALSAEVVEYIHTSAAEIQDSWEEVAAEAEAADNKVAAAGILDSWEAAAALSADVVEYIHTSAAEIQDL